MWWVLGGCLINWDLYEQRKFELTDHDGDGFVWEDDCNDSDAAAFPGADEICDDADTDCDGVVDEEPVDGVEWFEDGDGDGFGEGGAVVSCAMPDGYAAADTDCDDSRADVYPGAEDAWYDGVDANCLGEDDFDQDADGDRDTAFKGGDCDDTNPSVSSLNGEGWYDSGVDNNCDGSIEDPASIEVDELAWRMVGDAEDGQLGVSLLVVPAGWQEDGPVVLAAAPFSGGGDVYGWPGAEATSSDLDGATWHLQGEAASYLGYGMGWAGSASAPVVGISAEGVDGLTGKVALYSDLSQEPYAEISGSVAGALFGGQVLSGHDQDGDGVADLVVTAPLDSRRATNAGAAYVFLDPATLGDATTADADLEFTSGFGGALLQAFAVGDANGDGVDDLGFGQDVPYPEGPGGYLVYSTGAKGSFEIDAVADVQFHGGPHVLSRVWDPDVDGAYSLLGASGGVASYALPLSGAVTPWDNGEQILGFEDALQPATLILSDVGEAAGHLRFLVTAQGAQGIRGLVAYESPYFRTGDYVEDGLFSTYGEAPGDGLGMAAAHGDLDGDGMDELVLGAPGSDAGTDGGGAVYIVQAPE